MKKLSPKVWLVLGVLVFVVVIDLIVKPPFWGSAKNRLIELLHRNAKLEVKGDSVSITSRSFLKKYYNDFGYKKNWTDTTRHDDKYRDMLLSMLQYADSLGLDRNDYHENYLHHYDSLSHLPDFEYAQYESENELIFTDAALTFLYHVAYGKDINIGYNGISYNIDSARILKVFNQLLVNQNWHQTLDSIEPKIIQYQQLKNQLNRLQAYTRMHPQADTLIAGKDSVYAIALKLQALGLIADTADISALSPGWLKAAIKKFQSMMSIDTSGTFDDKTLALLNYPLSARIAQIKESLNYWRWTGRLKEQEFILVNIPAATLRIVESDSAKDISMRVIVGKTATQTPSFTSYITKVITYPYWNVPFSIATKEMLPKIRKRISYLDDNNLQVLDKTGKQVDPQRVDWNRYSEKYFPYKIRQSTGCDNSLGVLKFDLNSPYSIYLHDTNRKDLFAKGSRFLSHGCVRIEKPMVLAEFLLNQGLDSATIAALNKCIKDETPSEFKLKKRFPVLIFYMTADIDENGHLKFYNDVYGREEKKAA
jgi:murein L,D-transpeptidase YcbB/YkuD